MEEKFLLDLPSIKHIHFIGIGGISMSGLAEILNKLGYKVSGSDAKMSSITEKLAREGITIFNGHNAENVYGADLCVYSAAVKPENSERMEAQKLSIPSIERATLLGQIMKKYPISIAISGTHGKTTTTSMVSMIMLEAQLNPTIHIGGVLDAIEGNTKVGGDKYFIMEACEYVESFLKFHPYMALVLNIELDHVDYFRDINHIKNSFLKFISQVPKEGYVIACYDDPNVKDVIEKADCKKITYGLKAQDAQWSAKNISYDDLGCASFTLTMNKEELGEIKLNVPGIHNINNALGAIAACYTLGCDLESIKQGLFKFHGTDKRFQLKGVADNIHVIDDYAHHPTEIMATLKAARNGSHSKIWCVFQPHTYTRAKAFLSEFASAFEDADEVIVTDIYAARETDTGEIHSRAITEKIQFNGKKAEYISSFEDIADYLVKNAAPGEMIITMGAGDVCKVGELFLKKKSNA